MKVACSWLVRWSGAGEEGPCVFKLVTLNLFVKAVGGDFNREFLESSLWLQGDE